MLFLGAALFVNILVNVGQTFDDACAQGTSVNVHVCTVIPGGVDKLLSDINHL